MQGRRASALFSDFFKTSPRRTLDHDREDGRETAGARAVRPVEARERAAQKRWPLPMQRGVEADAELWLALDMSRANRARASASAFVLCVFGIVACGPSAIPLNGTAPAEGVATIREPDGFIVDEDGHVEISRVDDTPVPAGSAYSVSAGKHKVELIRNSPTKANSAGTYFLKAGGKYVAWNGCGTKKVEKTGSKEPQLLCPRSPQLLPEQALHCYQEDDRTSAECKSATDEWSEAG